MLACDIRQYLILQDIFCLYSMYLYNACSYVCKYVYIYICVHLPTYVDMYVYIYIFVHAREQNWGVCDPQNIYNNTTTQVLLYNGQLDVLIAAPLTENFLLMLDWDGADAYAHAKRHIWKIKSMDTEIAGFIRQVNNLSQVNTINFSKHKFIIPLFSDY